MNRIYLEGNAIWYTPVSGIWQTVWLEPVSSKYISNVVSVADIDNKNLKVKVGTQNTTSSDVVQIVLKEQNTIVAMTKGVVGETLELALADVKLWSPESPFLYDLEVTLLDKGKKTDKVKSYAAMRKISMHKDQGWWPDGLYTAPTDEALAYDIEKTKDWGFNMIRKHIKVEPARWYTHCDRLGILVWQDMPSGDNSPKWIQYNYFDGKENERSIESEENFKKEWREIMDYLMPYPSIVVWVPFNEAWGQFKTKEIAEWTEYYDPSRLVNAASGGNHYTCGDMLDLHHYPGPEMFLYDAQRATVLGEYGGIGLVLKEHLWEPDRNWGYVQFNTSKEATDKYLEYANVLKDLIPRGFSAAVYTQTTDVEVEINGLITYYRKVIKLDEKALRKINREICDDLK